MVSLTQRAHRGFAELLLAHQVPPGHGVRLVPGTSGELAMVIDIPTEADEVISVGQTGFLMMNRGIARALEQAQIDCFHSWADGRRMTAFSIGLERPRRSGRRRAEPA
jgi:hypothetical protein